MKTTDPLSLLQGKNTLRDSELTSVSIAASFGMPELELKFKLTSLSDFDYVTLRFSDIDDFSITYEKDSSFLDVWDLKFLKLEDNSYYISIDPDPETLESAGCTNVKPTAEDRFFVRAKYIEGEFSVKICDYK